MMLDVLDAVALQPMEIDLREKLETLNSCFQSAVTPENGYFGVTQVDKGNGLLEITGRDSEGHIYRDYYRNDLLFKRRVALGNHEWAVFDYDDAGTGYLKTTQLVGKSGVKVASVELTPGVKVVKGNFTAEIDSFGRPCYSKIENLQLRESIGDRKQLSPKLKDESYRVNDHRGHIIADQFGGPATKENVVAQLDAVNQGKMRDVERIVADYKSQGHNVDYSVETKYIGSDKRPSSFEPHIVVDGKEVDLPDGLKKLYNDDIDKSGLSSMARRAATEVGERFGLAHEAGVESAKLAAAITCSVSAYENISSFIDGEIDGDDMVKNIVCDTCSAGGIAYGTTFVTEAVAQSMAASSSELISAVGGSGAPALVVSFAVQSYGDISDFAQGKIDAVELAYNLGENAAEVGGGAGGALVGAQIGMVAGPVGAAAGSLVGGVVGCALASEAYATAVELGTDGVDRLSELVGDMASATMEAAAEYVPDQLESVRGALNTFFEENGLSFGV